MIHNKRIISLVQIAIVCALYVAMSLAVAPLSFGAIQFRFGELLVLLVFYNKKYSLSLIIGCLICNFFSPFGIIDVFVGTLATILTCLAMMPIKNLWLASLMPTVFCIIIGIEITLLTNVNLWLTSISVMAGEFAVVTVLGCPIFKLVEKNKELCKLLDFNSQKNMIKKINKKNTQQINNSSVDNCKK